MLGIEYFEKRLVDIYEYSLMKYTCGTGKLTIGPIDDDVNWEAVISVTGELILVLSASDVLAVDSSIMRDERGSFYGNTLDGEWTVSATNVFITNMNFQFGDCVSTRLTCAVDDFSMTRKDAGDFSVSHIEGCLSNFNFMGLEATAKRNGWTRDRFTVSVCDKDVVFRESLGKKEILGHVRSKRIDRAILSTVVIPVNDGETEETVEDQLDRLSWFLSLPNVNVIMSPVINYWVV